jgi:hypothetical protein
MLTYDIIDQHYHITDVQADRCSLPARPTVAVPRPDTHQHAAPCLNSLLQQVTVQFDNTLSRVQVSNAY